MQIRNTYVRRTQKPLYLENDYAMLYSFILLTNRKVTVSFSYLLLGSSPDSLSFRSDKFIITQSGIQQVTNREMVTIMSSVGGWRWFFIDLTCYKWKSFSLKFSIFVRVMTVIVPHSNKTSLYSPPVLVSLLEANLGMYFIFRFLYYYFSL